MEFAKHNTCLNSNKSTRIKYSALKVIPTTISSYFFWNYENIYFLILALFQLATLKFIPKEWSPTGPYSTFIPLLLCILIELIGNLVKYYKDLNLDYTENNKEYHCLNPSTGKTNLIKNQDIYPGCVIYLQKEDICPIDGILVDTSNNEKFSKISLALLTGESNLHYVVKPYKYFKNKDYIDANLQINDYCSTDFHNIKATMTINNKEYKVQGDSFIVAGSIIKSDDVYIWVTACGSNKKSYSKNKLRPKINTVDQFIGRYMMSINARLLLCLILFMVFIKMILVTGFSLYNFVFFGIQNWILFNGFIPFSIKILLIFSRNLQSHLNNRGQNIIVNNSMQIDDIGKIKKILSDKTGTMTKNELEFSNLLEVWKDNVVDVNTYKENSCDIGLEFHKCLGLCIHQIENKFSTEEDKTIRYRYQYLNNKITQSGSEIGLVINNNRHNYKYIDLGGLDFTFERKMSSKIVKYENRYYIYSKGSMDTIFKKLNEGYKFEFKRLDKLISDKNPELRLLACAFREISHIELQRALADSVNRSAMIISLENNLNLIGVIGIKDNLQQGVSDVVTKCENQFNIPVCLLTGDRKITALAIAKEAGLITGNIFDYTPENTIIDNVHNKTLIFNGSVLDNIDMDEYLIKCKNFIGYSLIPEHKKKIAGILENSGIKVLTIGDGFNDLGMFDTGSTSVAVKGNSFVESQADFVIKEFRDLVGLFDLSLNCNYKNSNLINFTFYRCAMVTFALLTYCVINYNKSDSLFNGFVLQAFNFAWLLFGLVYYTLVDNKETHNKITNNISFSQTTIWTLSGLTLGIMLVLVNYYWFSESEYLSDIIGFVLICILNIKIATTNDFDKWGILMALVGVLNFVIYMIYNGSLFETISSLTSVGISYWILIIGTYVMVNFCLI